MLVVHSKEYRCLQNDMRRGRRMWHAGRVRSIPDLRAVIITRIGSVS
jgi:hypothetical protein